MRRDRKYPGVSKYQDRHGRWRWRARAKGKPSVEIHGDYDSPQFIAEWNAWANGARLDIGAKRTVPGTINALIAGYYLSPAFNDELAETTRKSYRAVLERFREKNGDKRINAITKQGIIAKRDKMKPDPSNMFLRVIRHLCKYALDRDLMAVDPTAGLRKVQVKTDGYHTWTIEEVEQFEARHPIGTMPHVAMSVLLFLAQRRSDAVKFGRQHEVDDGAALRVRQHKTGKWLVLRVLPPLRASIDAAKRKGLTYIENSYGRPFASGDSFGNWFRERCDEAGLEHCSAHGLRKAAATRMANARCTEHEIQAVTGLSLATIRIYTRAANQMHLAAQSQGAIMSPKGERQAGEPDTRFANSAANPLKQKG